MTRFIRAGRPVARRDFLAGAVSVGAALSLPAPAVLAQTRAPIRLGMLNTFTGPITYAGASALAGMNLYFDSIGWTIAGRNVELIKEDDQFNPQIGLQKAKKFVESDHVDMILGPQASNVAIALLNYTKQNKVFLVVTGAGTDAISWERYPYLFRTSLSGWQLSHPMAEWIYANLAKEIVLTASDYAGGRDVIDEFRRPYLAKGGTVMKEIYPPLGTTDFSPYLTVIKSINPPATYNFYPGTDAVRFVQQYSQYGLKEHAPLTGYALVDASTLPAQGRDALGVITSTIYTDALDNPENRRFVAAYRAKNGANPDLYSDYGYVAARVVDETLKALDGDATNKDKLAEEMVKVAFKGPRGPFRFDPVTHNPIQDVYICKVVDSGGTLVNQVIGTIREVRDPGVKDG